MDFQTALLLKTAQDAFGVEAGKTVDGKLAITVRDVMFTYELDGKTPKNFRDKSGKIFARTVKSFRNKHGFESGSSGACAIHMTLSQATSLW